MVSSSGLSNTTLQQKATAITEGVDYQAYLIKTGPNYTQDLKKWLHELIEWFKELTKGMHLTPASSHSWIERAMVWSIMVIIGIIVLFALFMLGKWIFHTIQKHRKLKKAEQHGISVSLADRAMAQQSFLSLANQALRQHNYRQAMHYLFLSAVTQVITDHHFNGTDRLTNREIAQYSDFSRFPHAHRLATVFSNMVRLDEQFWFGIANATESDYESLKILYDELNSALHIQEKRYA